MQSAITDQPFPFNLAMHRSQRHGRLPTHQRRPFLENQHDHSY
jgi:hypothetical protein